MCQRVQCNQCGRPTFAGCGRHVEQVLGDVPPASRCRCREAPAKRNANADSKSNASASPLARLQQFFTKR